MWPPRRTEAAVQRVVLWCRWLLVLLLAVAATDADAATLFDPALRFQRARTPHFTVYYHQGAAATAARLMRIAEETYTVLQTRFAWTLPAHTHVVLTDQSDLANGYATPLPYNTVVLFNAWPAGHDTIGLSDDWLRLVFTHEFTHIAHLDRSRGWAGAVRRVFGRVPVAFPNLSLPTWQIEGIATYFESAVTGQGRAHAWDFRAIEREPARAGGRVLLDRVNGGLIEWPGGTAVYSAGLGFHEYLAQRSGEDKLVELADRTAGRLPYLGAPAFKRVFGGSLGDLWTTYQASLRDATASQPAATGPRQLTRERYLVSGIRFLPPACEDCAPVIAYSTRNPHEFPSLKTVGLEGGQGQVLSTRYLGDTTGISQTRLVFDQREFARNVGLYSDLYLLDRRSGDRRRLTEGLRLQDPDLSPDGRTIAATQQDRDRRRLVLLPLDERGQAGSLQALRDDADVQYSTPRWSPDGRRLAVERHVRGDLSEVVVITVPDGALTVVARGATRAVTPAWRPDGQAIVAAVDTPGGPFNLREFRLDGTVARVLTTTSGGALWPDVSADGQVLAYAGYTVDGYEVFTQPYAMTAEPVPQPVSLTPDREPMAARPAADAAGPAAAPYRPWSTLAPRAWSPLFYTDVDQSQVGLTTSGIDVLGYHAWAASAWWRVRAPAGAPGLDDRVPDWNVAYAYDRWQPQLFASASRATSFFAGASAEDGGVSTLREQTVEGGVIVPVRRALRSQRLLLSAIRSANHLEARDGIETFERLAVRGGWTYRSARQYGYSISAEDGIAAAVAIEAAGDRPGGLGDAVTATADGRAYLPGLARHHVIALRAGGGVSTGPRALGRTFRLGGASANANPLDFGRGAFSLLRGFGTDAFAGRRVAVLNAEYRFPVWRVERGYGTWPLFIRQFHAAAFVDAGHAWRTEARWQDVKTSLGVELSADVVAGYALPFAVTAGAARGHDGAGQRRDRTTYYLRVGRAF